MCGRLRGGSAEKSIVLSPYHASPTKAMSPRRWSRMNLFPGFSCIYIPGMPLPAAFRFTISSTWKIFYRPRFWPLRQAPIKVFNSVIGWLFATSVAIAVGSILTRIFYKRYRSDTDTAFKHSPFKVPWRQVVLNLSTATG